MQIKVNHEAYMIQSSVQTTAMYWCLKIILIT